MRIGSTAKSVVHYLIRIFSVDVRHDSGFAVTNDVDLEVFDDFLRHTIRGAYHHFSHVLKQTGMRRMKHYINNAVITDSHPACHQVDFASKRTKILFLYNMVVHQTVFLQP